MDYVGVMPVLLVAVAGALSWGVRGSYGHEKGASFPGALIALCICVVSGRPDWQQAGLFLALVSGAGIALGGCMSYGKVTGYARSTSWPNAAYGLACLFVIGGLWGGVGGCLLGLALAGWSPWALLWVAGGIAIAQQVSYHLVVKVARVRMTPPRSDDWARCLGALVLLGTICLVRREQAGLVGLSWGVVGWGTGFTVGMFFQSLGRRTGIQTNWWRVMEMTLGFFGGGALAMGLLPLAGSLPELPALGWGWWLAGAYAVLWLIPMFHVQHNFEHYRQTGALSRGWWAGRSPLGLTRQSGLVLAALLGLGLAAWHWWGPQSPLAAAQAAALALGGMCVLLGTLLDVGAGKGVGREVNAKWFVAPYLLVAAGVLLVPRTVPVTMLPVPGVAAVWWGLPLGLVLAGVLAAISSRFYPQDPPGCHRRFGPGADPEQWYYVPPKQEATSPGS